MNAIGGLPWKLTFSYGRALQAAALKAWGGKAGERRRRPARLHPPRPHEQPRRHGNLDRGGREKGRLTSANVRIAVAFRSPVPVRLGPGTAA